MVLVIDDNPNGLMFALSYTFEGKSHWQCLKNIGWIEGCNPSIQTYALRLDNECQSLWRNKGIKRHMKVCSMGNAIRRLNEFEMNAIYIHRDWDQWLNHDGSSSQGND